MESQTHTHRRVLLQIKKCIQKSDDFLITTHINPDGDCISSVLVFAFLLKKIGKKYRILIDDDIPKKFQFLPGVKEILRFGEQHEDFQAKTIVVLDTSHLERIGNIREAIPQDAVIINMDHHTSNQNFGFSNAVDEKESSTVEVVYELFRLFKISISPEVATLVYTGIICDTGRFLFPNTTHRSLSICSDMIKKGASLDDIAENLYYRTSQKTIRALATALSTIEFHFNGAVSCIHLSNGMLESNEKVETEGFVDHLMTIEGTEVEFIMVEKEPNLFRVSFRSKRYIDVNEIAKHFGGGGHTRAAGCSIRGSVEEVRDKILHVLKSHLV